MIKAPTITKTQYKVTHQPYDSIKSEIGFQHIGSQIDHKHVLADFDLRAEQIMISPESTSELDVFVVKVKNILTKLPGIRNVIEVGSYAMKTMRKSKLIADIVLEFIATPLDEEYRKLINQDVLTELNNDATFNPVSAIDCVRSGIQLTLSNDLGVIIYPATSKAEHIKDAVNKGHLVSNITMVKHKEWFHDHCMHDTANSLICLIFDTRDRFSGLKALNPWLCYLLGQYCILNTLDRRAVPLHIAYKRFLQLLASGIFLSNSAGLADETLPDKPRAHMVLTIEQQEELCCTAQTILRIYCHGEYKKIIGLETSEIDVCSNILINNILVRPSEIINEKCD